MALRPVYSVTLLAVSSPASDQLIVAPSNATVVIRDVLISEASGVNGSLCILYGPQHATVYAWQRTAADPLAAWNWQGRAVLNPGLSCSFHVVSGTWNIWASGYSLPSP